MTSFYNTDTKPLNTSSKRSSWFGFSIISAARFILKVIPEVPFVLHLDQLVAQAGGGVSARRCSDPTGSALRSVTGVPNRHHVPARVQKAPVQPLGKCFRSVNSVNPFIHENMINYETFQPVCASEKLKVVVQVRAENGTRFSVGN